ncbi:putative integral membrane protein conserved region-domain-containing protein [Phycomyces nitens]|nr:putative integral membrane protein conserved region-domain-containing protein [Phycomyces nitens]
MQDSVSLTVAYVLGGLTLFPAIAILILVVLSIQHRKILIPFRSTVLGAGHKSQAAKTSGLFFQTGWVEATSSPQRQSRTIKYMLNRLLWDNQSTSYYAVLKFDTLFLYDSEQQLDCRHVFVIHQHSVYMYPPGLKDHELFSRPTCIRLTNSKQTLYINCSRNIDKEDWYLAFVNASKLHDKPHRTAHQDSTRFDQTAMNHLLATIHSDEHHFQTQWLNSIIGRIFFGLYKTDTLKSFFHNKICKKIEKLNARRPPFLDTIHVRSVDPGHGLPYFTQPRLLKLSPSGELMMEVDVVYGGGFRFDIETVLRWKYLDGLRPLTVNIVLAMTLKQIKGKLLLKIKEPPTNRFWIGFYEMPKMEWIVEPLVWDKRVGFSMVVKAIETKIQEIIAETMVLPNMDDFVFFPSNNAGGLFEPFADNDLLAVDRSEHLAPTEPIVKPELSVLSTDPTNLLDHTFYTDEALWLPEKNILPDLFSGSPEMQTHYELFGSQLVSDASLNPSKVCTSAKVRRWFRISKSEKGSSVKPDTPENDMLSSLLPKGHPLEPAGLSSTDSSIDLSEDSKDGWTSNKILLSHQRSFHAPKTVDIHIEADSGSVVAFARDSELESESPQGTGRFRSKSLALTVTTQVNISRRVSTLVPSKDMIDSKEK